MRLEITRITRKNVKAGIYYSWIKLFITQINMQHKLMDNIEL